MNEEIEYAEMLEIPVSTVNVVKKKTRAHRQNDLKESLIHKVNENVSERSDFAREQSPAMLESAADAPTENVYPSAESFDAGDEASLTAPETKNELDTVVIEGTRARRFLWWKKKKPTKKREENENAFPYDEAGERKAKIALSFEFAVCCALCATIFLTNVFMPESAINTFFRGLSSGKETADARRYTDFKLTSVVGNYSSAELSLSPTGVLSFQEKGCVYPAVDGQVSAVRLDGSGKYEVKISHSKDFYGVLTGLDYVYYDVGQTVFANVPVGYTNGDAMVQATLYDRGELLDCFTLDEENCLAWVKSGS